MHNPVMGIGTNYTVKNDLHDNVLFTLLKWSKSSLLCRDSLLKWSSSSLLCRDTLLKWSNSSLLCRDTLLKGSNSSLLCRDPDEKLIDQC